jgi:hypothetical protein
MEDEEQPESKLLDEYRKKCREMSIDSLRRVLETKKDKFISEALKDAAREELQRRKKT